MSTDDKTPEPPKPSRDECHALLDQLLPEGLTEAEDTLREMVKFYVENAAIQERQQSSPPPKLTKVTTVGVETRPVSEFEPDDEPPKRVWVWTEATYEDTFIMAIHRSERGAMDEVAKHWKSHHGKFRPYDKEWKDDGGGYWSFDGWSWEITPHEVQP